MKSGKEETPSHITYENSVNDNLNLPRSIEKLRDCGYFLLPLPARQKYKPPANWISQKGPYDIPATGNVAIGTRGELAILITNDGPSTEWAWERFGAPNVRSQRGAHWYFRNVKNFPNEANKQTPIGVLEFHTTNKYALIPPSVHPSGTKYEWERELPPVSALPEAPDLRHLFHPGGTHHTELLHLSASLAGKGKSGEEIAKALRELVNSFPDPEAHPEKEIDEMTKSAFAKFHDSSRANANKGAPEAESASGCDSSGDLYFPGPKDVYDELMKREAFKTVREIGTDREDIWYFNGQIFERAEEHVRAEAHVLFMEAFNEMLLNIELIPRDKRNDFTEKLYGRLTNAIHTGPKEGQISEVLAMIRRTTFTDASEMNPPGYIPFLNGLLDLNERKLIPFTAGLFYTYQVNANLLNQRITLLDTPRFTAQLNQVFYPWDIPLVLAYFGYSLYPDFPAHKVLGIFGRERVGKGTLGRVLKGLIKRGAGSFSLGRILTAERFAFSGIIGKNVLVDFELKRKYKRGTVKDWAAFNNLFGQDVLSVENKGREVQDRTSSAKGIVIGNLPIFSVDDSAAIERWLPVVTRITKPARLKTNVDREILEKERDQVATLLVRVLFGLMDRGWIFPGQLTPDATVELMERLADPVENFIEECTESLEGAAVEANKAYEAFVNWCGDKGITPIAAQSFKKSFGWTYPKKKYHRGKETGYEFIGCALIVSEEDEKEGEYQDRLQVGTGPDHQETRENGFRGNGYRRFQHASLLLRAEKGKEDRVHDHDIHVKVRVHKLEPGIFDPGNLENKPPQENKTGSNLQMDSDSLPGNEPSESQPDPSNSSVQSGFEEDSHHTEPITINDGDLIRDQLIALDYILDPSLCGESLDGKHYKIAVHKPSDREKRGKLLYIMASSHFSLVNTGAYGPLIFARPLRRDSQ